MNVFHIGTIAFETSETKREIKSIGGISGYIIELINYSLSKGVGIGFVGKIYNYSQDRGISYIQVQNDVTTTNSFLIHLFLKSLIVRIPKGAIIHAHRPDHLATFIFLKNRPSVLTLHGQQAHTVNIRKGKCVRSIYHILEKYAFKRASALIAVDLITKDFYSKLYPQYEQKIRVIPTGVNTDMFYPIAKDLARRELGFNLTDKIIIYVGRVEPPKRLDIIIRAFHAVLQQEQNYRLVIVGDGVLMDDIKALSVQLSIDEHVSFLGVRKRAELPLLYNSADVSILISGNEGSPLSVKESLACGIPVVANMVGDIGQLIHDSFNGYIIDEEDIVGIAERLIAAVNHSDSIKQNCIDTIQFFTTAHVSDDVVELYKKISHE